MPRAVGKSSALAWCLTINSLEKYRADKGSRGAGRGVPLGPGKVRGPLRQRLREVEGASKGRVPSPPAFPVGQA